jgi:hypothetical protein
MAPSSITCPYCNAFVDAPASGTTRVLCPRCGERFPYHPSDSEPVAGQNVPQAPPAAPAAADPDVPMPRRFSNYDVVLAILGVMFLMALVSLTLSLETVQFRRENDRHISKEQVVGVPLVIKVVAALWIGGLVLVLAGARPRRVRETVSGGLQPERPRMRWLVAGGFALAVLGAALLIFSGPLRRRSSQLPAYTEPTQAAARSVSPAQLEALGYLPPDTNVIAGVHLGELLQSADNRALLDQLKIGPIDLSPERIQKLTGLKREDIDYVVLGLRLEEIPRITAIVRTRTHFDPHAVRTALHGVPSPKAERANRFSFKLAQPAIEVEAWLLPEHHLLIFGLTRADLDAVPAEPSERLKQLSPQLRQMVQLRLDPDARIWAAGNIEHWERTWISKAPNAALVQKVRSFGAGLIPGTPEAPHLKLRAEVNCVDADAARAVATYLTEHKPEGVELTLPEPQGDWVSLKAQLKGDDVSRWLTPKGE